MAISIKNSSEIEIIRKSCALVKGALDLAETRIKAGVSTKEIDLEIGDFIRKNDAKAAFLGFHGYPANTCISIDEQVVHGIPGNRILKDGEIVSVDIGVEYKGYFGDAARTFSVGNVSEEKQRLLKITKEALYCGIEQAREGNRLYDISAAIQQHVESAGFSVVRDLVGHGIGKSLHEAPQIPNFGRPNHGPRLKSGMVFAIEPMVNIGTFDVMTLDDNWTVVTLDGLPSAHFEHDILIRDGKAEILTE